MGSSVNVTVDDDIYDVICDIKKRSGVSSSQAGNRLMRAGINYNFLGSELAEVKAQNEALYALVAALTERLGYGDILDQMED